MHAIIQASPAVSWSRAAVPYCWGAPLPPFPALYSSNHAFSWSIPALSWLPLVAIHCLYRFCRGGSLFDPFPFPFSFPLSFPFSMFSFLIPFSPFPYSLSSSFVLLVLPFQSPFSFPFPLSFLLLPFSFSLSLFLLLIAINFTISPLLFSFPFTLHFSSSHSFNPFQRDF